MLKTIELSDIEKLTKDIEDTSALTSTLAKELSYLSLLGAAPRELKEAVVIMGNYIETMHNEDSAELAEVIPRLKNSVFSLESY